MRDQEFLSDDQTKQKNAATFKPPLGPGGADAAKKKQNFFNFMGSSRASGKSISNPKRISQRRKAIKDNDFEQRKI